jgi:PAS domain-containing protein
LQGSPELLQRDSAFSEKSNVSELSPHIENIRDNLPLLADFGFASVLLAVPEEAGLRVIATYRSTTAVAPIVTGYLDTILDRDAEPEAYAALESGQTEVADAVRSREQVPFLAQAHPVFEGGDEKPAAIIIRHIAQAAVDNPGRMEGEFLSMADAITDLLKTRPLLTVDGALFSTTRRPGDGVLRIDVDGTVVYPSPNAVAIMRRAGFEERVRTSPASALPGGGFAITPVLGTHRSLEKETEVLGRTLLYRSIGLGEAAVVFVEDVTEIRKQEAELASRDEIINEIREQVQSLSDQLDTRKALDRAKAILIERGMTEAQAFAKLQKTAMNFRKPLKEVCDAIILSDEMN